jgi:N-hydroxyarylamine O-acetyltransferase
MIDAGAYLERIRYHGSTAPTLGTLRGLHLAHLLSVPFENLDVSLGRPLRTQPEALFEKIVRRRRGGLCYELNGAFAELLRALGFRVELLSAAVCREPDVWGLPFDHLTLRVTLDEPWLADVGFGRDSFREPLRLETAEPQERYGVTYRLAERGPLRVLQLRRGEDWIDCYRFGLEVHEFAAFDAACRRHQIEGPFASVPLCGLATREGRITLVEHRLRIVTGESIDERQLAGEQARLTALREYFGIVP